MAKFLIGILTGIILAGLVLVILVIAAVRFAEKPPEVAEDSVLVLELEGDLPERAPLTIPLPFFEARAPLTVSDVWDITRKAAVDSRIRAVVFMPNGLSAGWGKLEEIRSELERLKKAGKPVAAFLRSPSGGEYYASMAADHVYMPPEDLLNLKGLMAETMYFRQLLNKVGVQVEIEHAGKYKDFGDMFTRTSMSPETRLVMNSILDVLYNRLLTTVAEGRHKTVDEVRAIINEGPFLSQQALSKGLVDALLYEDQVFSELKKQVSVSKLNKVSARNYLRVPASSLNLTGKQRIALVVAEGDITSGGGTEFPDESGIRATEFNRLLQRVREDSSIRAVIVRIDSPGGSSFASDEIWRQMNLLSEKKPLVISMSDTAASGGYYIAMTGDPIVAYPETYTGSIGVLYGKAVLQGLYNKLGIQKDILTRGRFADIDSDYVPLSDAARKKLREAIEEDYKVFVERVAKARGQSYEQINEVAQGRVWLGVQAKEKGLVDELGGIDRAIQTVKAKARIPATEEITLVVYPPKESIFERLFKRSRQSLIDERLRSLLRKLHASAWAEGGLLRLMPYSIQVQ
jgi:protease-4